MPPCLNHPHVDASAACARCAQPFCDACLVEFLGARYCGPCRNQRLLEVQGSSAAPFAGTGQVDLGRWLSAGWQIIQNDIPTFGLAMLLGLVVSLATCGIAMPAMSCGLYLMAYRKMTTGSIAVENLFDGFRRFLWAFLGMLLFLAVLGVSSLAFEAPSLLLGLLAPKATVWVLVASLAGMGGQVLFRIALTGCAFFYFPHIAARNVNPVEAATDCWRVFRRNPLMYCLTAWLFSLIAGLGVFGCCIGLFVTGPLIIAATAQGYADLFGLRPEDLT